MAFRKESSSNHDQSERKGKRLRKRRRILRHMRNIGIAATVGVTLATGPEMLPNKFLPEPLRSYTSQNSLDPGTYYEYPLVKQSDINACLNLLNTPTATIQEAGGYRFDGPSTIACPVFVAELRESGSPAAPYATDIYELLIKKGQNPSAYLAMFFRESWAATDNGPSAKAENWCNMLTYWNTPNSPKVGPVADFSKNGGWVGGVDNCVMMIQYWGDHSATPNPNHEVDPILNIIVPSPQNPTKEYIATVKMLMDKFVGYSFPQYEGFISQVSIPVQPNLTRRGKQ